MSPIPLTLAHLGATLAMVGVIWTIQVVHYPLFGQVGASSFGAYHAAHTHLITWVVGPLMLVEVAAAGLLLASRPAAVPGWAVWVGAGLLALIWGSTALVQVPLHGALSGGFDEATHRWLVQSNWIRTAAWSARGALALWMAARLMGAPPAA